MAKPATRPGPKSTTGTFGGRRQPSEMPCPWPASVSQSEDERPTGWSPECWACPRIQHRGNQPGATTLGTGPVVVFRRHDGHLPFGHEQVLVPQPEGLTDPHAHIEQQEPVTQVSTPIQDGLGLRSGQNPGPRLPGRQLDRAPPLAAVLPPKPGPATATSREPWASLRSRQHDRRTPTSPPSTGASLPGADR
jgi:hypothetical protein